MKVSFAGPDGHAKNASIALTSDRDTLYQIIRSVFPDFDHAQAPLEFTHLGIDSFDLMALRTALDQHLGCRISDEVWMSLTSFQDLIDCWAAPESLANGRGDPVNDAHERALAINMPQMAVGGLSESWLFRELGDMHWMAICDALGSPSHAIVDALGNRLYATFVRIRWEGTAHLKAFQENEPLRLRGALSRYGRSMFISDSAVTSPSRTIQATLLSTFALRQSDNTSLLRSEPTIPGNSRVPVLASLPQFAAEYRELRKRGQDTVELGGGRISVAATSIFETEYSLNPYHDINGVNLLYFAAYPGISDICEREFVHRSKPSIPIETDWALESSTLARDVFYYGNCTIDDRLLFRLHAFQCGNDGVIRSAASLLRQSDQQRICDIFTAKAHHG